MDHHFWWKLGLFPNMTPGLSRLDGIILLSVFVLYIYTLIRQESKFSKTVEETSRKEVIKYFLIFLLTLALLLISSNFVIDYAKLISSDLNISPLLIGIFLISLGTTLPELMFTVKSVFAKHENMAIGDIVGSVIANSTLVLGVTAVINPVVVNSLIYLTSTLFMIFSAFIFLTFAESESGISWREGISLIMLYFLFVIIETYLKTAKF
jgi:cation:H+ antiporter